MDHLTFIAGMITGASVYWLINLFVSEYDKMERIMGRKKKGDEDGKS